MEKHGMQAARLHGVGDFRVERVPVPRPSGEELLLKVAACGICGSDIPRIFINGTSTNTYPLTIGHEFSGVVAAVGEKADAGLIGSLGAVFPIIPCMKCEFCLAGQYALCENYNYLGSRCDGGFAEYCLIPSERHLIKSGNPNTSPLELAMAEPASVAQHAVRRSALRAGQTVLIFGAGPIGLLVAKWCSIFGAMNVLVADVAEDKVSFAQSLGMHAVNSAKTEIADELNKLTKKPCADVVFECSGAGQAFKDAISCVKATGTIALLGNPASDVLLSRREYATLLRHEVDIKPAWNSCCAGLPINEWRCTVDMLDRGILHTADLITHRLALEEIPSLCQRIANREIPVCKALFTASSC